MIPLLGPHDPFPPVSKALRSPNGLLCAGADLSPERLLDAYSKGIFPWFSAGDPILWWSPHPRMVLFPGELKVSRSLRKAVARGAFETRFDTAFAEVMRACAEPRDGQAGTWIVPEMVAAYTRLHERGFAHSVESWRDGRLAGGLYGILLGRVFFGESMFSRETDASKVALVKLVARLEALGVGLVDCQQATRHLASLGAREIPRREFAQRLAESIQYPPTGSRWPATEEA
ncbi:MAG TPA: leucyl/phenylalanyl-tRNA--protein transferase [Usitatibacteraceae bacterium]|nr:leucyl/phenylalanyl-tRNA--protein transferase [Burkholderiales bacterium]HQW37341.1 leucyl/phenylalanyl-tRNA--protein transferase [Usitatibacteraceae bacterium]HQY46871.1 leucyl/phenylalanyl-tRNA--protein transferase [Usitatibacteraceae bacterium]HRA22643.1 leucyl/phenylalanyl-tRNA--protein transferase [Usitatibacteraceae bacterium]